MSRLLKNPIWLTLIMAALLGLGIVYDPERRNFYYVMLAIIGVSIVSSQGLMFVLKRTRKSPVPDSTVREMLKQCCDDTAEDDWAFFRFQPGVSLEEARLRAGSAEYSDDHRLQGFMTKFHFVSPGRPNVAIFYSPNRGLLLANVRMVRDLERHYGTYLLDTWFSLNGALIRLGMDSCDLDGPQTFAM